MFLPCALSLVLNHCQVHRIAAVAYNCYSDIIGPDSVTMETYKPALTKIGKSIQVSCFSFYIRQAFHESEYRKKEQALKQNVEF